MMINVLKVFRILFLAGSFIYALIIIFQRLRRYNQKKQYTRDKVNYRSQPTDMRMSQIQKIQRFHLRMLLDPAAHLYHTLIIVGFAFSLAGHVVPPLCLAGAGLMGFGSSMALIRRLYSRNPRLQFEFDKVIPLVCLLLIAITGGMSYLKIYKPDIPDTATLIFTTLHSFSISLTLIVFANTRLIHIMTASMQLNAKTPFNPPGAFYNADTTVQQVAKLFSGEDLDNPEREEELHYGLKCIDDLDSKDRVALDACTECGRCEAGCPAVHTGKLLSPKKFTSHLRHIMEENPGHPNFAEDEVLKEMTWQCSMCYSCESACPVSIDRVNTVANIRRNLILDKGVVAEDYKKVLGNLKRSANIWGYSEAAGMKVDSQSYKGCSQPADVTIWLGCFYSYDSNLQRILKNLMSLLEKANVTYNFIDQEICCGDSARRIGDEYLFQELAHQNIKNLAAKDIKKLLTLCPHCTNSLKNEYPAFGLNIPVMHYLEILPDLLKDISLQKTNNLQGPVFYHHSCYLSRCAQLSDIPYAILREHCGFTTIIPHRYAEGTTLCCGGGGGGILAEEKGPKRSATLIVAKAKEFVADKIVTSCPYCYVMLSDCCKSSNPEMEVHDLLEFLNVQ